MSLMRRDWSGFRSRLCLGNVMLSILELFRMFLGELGVLGPDGAYLVDLLC